jgi:hypothetical protein
MVEKAPHHSRILAQQGSLYVIDSNHTPETITCNQNEISNVDSWY